MTTLAMYQQIPVLPIKVSEIKVPVDPAAVSIEVPSLSEKSERRELSVVEAEPHMSFVLSLDQKIDWPGESEVGTDTRLLDDKVRASSGASMLRRLLAKSKMKFVENVRLPYVCRRVGLPYIRQRQGVIWSSNFKPRRSHAIPKGR